MALAAEETGYLRQVDVQWLEGVAAEAGVTIQLDRAVGDFVVQGSTLARVSRPLPPEARGRCGRAFNIGRERSFDQDMVYGLIVLSEVASRALSPSVNDPGTAIQVLRAGTRVLLSHDEARSRAVGSDCRHVHGPDTDTGLAYRAFFAPIARDGAGLLEVQVAVQDSLAVLATRAHRAHALTEAREAMARAMETLARDRERELLIRAAAEAR